MGYSDANTYLLFADEIAKIKKETANKKSSAGFFETIKEMLNDFSTTKNQNN